MSDIATTLTASLQRAIDGVIDSIATDGLKVLRRVLSEAGFDQSEYLRDYEVYAHVAGHQITFEIVLDVEAVLPEDEATQTAMEEQRIQAEAAEDEASRTYHLSRKTQRVRRMKDVRRGAKDARREAPDIRTTGHDRLIKHELAKLAPRSARVSRTGKLSVALKRSMRETEKKVVFPQGKFDGIIGKFMDDLKDVVSREFAPELQKMIGRHVP